MNLKAFFMRLAGLVVIALAAGPVFGLTVNLLLAVGLIPVELVDKAFGNILAIKAIYIWFGCLIVGFASLFLKESWRLILYFSPLYAPSLFAVAYTLVQQ